MTRVLCNRSLSATFMSFFSLLIRVGTSFFIISTSNSRFGRANTNACWLLFSFQNREVTSSNGTLTIPVLFPIPNVPPLMMGSELILDPPTPMQWQAIEEAVFQHNKKGSDPRIAHVDAAPIVAVLEDNNNNNNNNDNDKAKGTDKKYATIAAVVGMSRGDKYNMIDLTDSGSFMESLQKLGKDFLPSERRLRLVGIGRSNLKDFSFRVPTATRFEQEDDEGYLLVQDYSDERPPEQGHLSTNNALEGNNVVMASFQLLRDGDFFSLEFQGPDQPAHASPVHMLNRMSSLANKINRLHQERRRLVRGLQAVKARVQLAGLASGLEADWDGLGEVFAWKHNTESPKRNGKMSPEDIVAKFLSEFPKPDYSMSKFEAGIAESDNYGMGFSSSSMVDIPELTTAWMAKLDPFYTQHIRNTEAFYYEVLSFVAILSMEKVLQYEDLSWSLRCTNTIERLSKAHDWMLVHRERLLERAAIANQELRNCGEECTDLW